MRATFLPFNQPDLGPEEVEAVSHAIQSHWITRAGITTEFEAELSQYLDGVSVLALSSCTAGMHVALLACGIGPGDEVITTPYTFAASVNVILHAGATPVLVDVDPQTGNIDPSRIEDRIGPHTKAILPVHFAGHPVDLAAINTLRDHYHLTVIEDAAHAIASRYRSRKIGTHGNITAFSFYATKNLTTGEGGALVVPDPEVMEKVRMLSLHGMSRNAWNRYADQGSWFYTIELAGFKYNMTDIQAAMGRVQLKKLDAMQGRRQAIAARFTEGLKGLPVFPPHVQPNVGHAWHLYPLRLDLDAIEGDRADVIRDLKALNIGTSVHFIPIHLHPYYQKQLGYQVGDFPLAEKFYASEISLPLYPTMTDRDADDVLEALAEVLSRRLR